MDILHLSALQLFSIISESLVKANPLPNRYQYPVYYTQAITNNPLSKLWNFNERPCIVPPEIRNGLNVLKRALSLKMYFLV